MIFSNDVYYEVGIRKVWGYLKLEGFCILFILVLKFVEIIVLNLLGGYVRGYRFLILLV